MGFIPVKTIRVPDATTAIGRVQPVGTRIYNDDNNFFYKLLDSSAETDTITTLLASNKISIIGSGGGGFSGEWDFAGYTLLDPAFGEITADENVVEDVTTFKINRIAKGYVSFNNSINKISNIKISDKSGNSVVFEISKTETYSTYITISGTYAATGTLSELTIGDNYTISFMYGVDDTPIIPDYLKGVANVGTDTTSLWLISPKSQHYNGNTYVVYIDFSDNKRKIAKYDHDTDEWTTTAWTQNSFVGGNNTTTKDYAHASPSLLIDSNGVIHITYTSAKNARVYYVRATNAEDITTFDTEITIAAGTDVSASYTSMIEHNGKTVLIYRGEDSGNSAVRRIISLDAGATWINDVLLIENASSDPDARVYYQSKISKTGRLHLSFHNTTATLSNHDLFHVYSDNISDAIPTFYTLENPSTAETLPISLVGNAKIYDSVTPGWDTCYMLGTAIDNNYDIHIIAYVKKSTADGELLHFYYNGTAWVNNTVDVEDLSSWTVGSVQGDIINHNGVLLLMTEYITDSSYGTYGKAEVKEFISFDFGITWKLSTIVTYETPTTTANPFYIRGTRNIGWFEGSNDYGVGKAIKTIFR